MRLNLALAVLLGGVVAAEASGKRPPSKDGEDNWSIFSDCIEQSHHARIEMKNGVVVENWRGKGACEEEATQDKQIQK